LDSCVARIIGMIWRERTDGWAHIRGFALAEGSVASC